MTQLWCHLLRFWFFRFLIAIIAVAGLGGHPAFCDQRGTSLLKRAQNEFSNERYDKAITLYRQYLRNNRGDYDSWNQLGAAYYHAGLPQRAIGILSNVAPRTIQRSYNLLYQGLSYEALGRLSAARRLLSAATSTGDNFSALAAFELASIEYQAREGTRAMQWLQFYLQKFPNHQYARSAQQMMASLRSGQYIAGVQGIKKPDIEGALFRYNSLSLMNRPHFWLAQLGYKGDWGTQKDPQSGSGVKTVEYQDHAIIANAGFGFGPVRSGKAEGTAGYMYKQSWLTDDERFAEYYEDPTDFAYQPFRLDLLERKHQLFGDYRQQFGSNFLAGVYGSFEYTFSGSRFGFDSLLAEVLDISETSLLVPFFGASYLGNMNTIFYLYMRKELNTDAPEFSNKTFDFFSGGTPVTSIGLSQYVPIPQAKADLNLELFRYEFIYNDFWLDFTRTGAILRARAEFYKDIFVFGYAGYYTDVYQVDVLKQVKCSYEQPSTNETSLRLEASSDPKSCPRTDDGTLYQLGIYYNFTPFTRFNASFTSISNANTDQSIFDRTENSVVVSLTTGFPTVDRTFKYVNRFGEAAFFKSEE
jgi:hypothetical protein